MEYNVNTNPYRCACSSNVDGGYTTAGDTCILDRVIEGGAGGDWSYSPDRAGSVSYSEIETRTREGEVRTSVSGAPRSSGTDAHYYLKAAVGCSQWKNPQDCQTLANLCVLHMYDENAQPCKVYNDIADSKDESEESLAFYPFYGEKAFKLGLPWLHYDHRRPEGRPANEIIREEAKVKFRASFDYENRPLGIFSTLRFKLAKYDIEGHFYGFKDLTNQLVICERPREEIDRIYAIGASVDIDCTYDLSNLVSPNAFDRPRLANYFFELFLVDYQDTLVDVPVLINEVDNFDAGSVGQNYPPNPSAMAQWALKRRFFLFDTISGIPEDEYY